MNGQPTIVYVDDDAKSRKVMELVLKNTMRLPAFSIFEDSERFIERMLALDPRPDIVLLDIHVKPLTGFQMLTQIRERTEFQGVPVVAVTASVMNEEVHQLRTAGFDGCISKPLDIETFPEQLQRVLKGEQIWRIH